MELTISAMPNTDKPTVLFGFHNEDFSQCVYLVVDPDPIACLKMASDIGDSFIEACGIAVKAHKDKVAAEALDTTGEPVQGSVSA